MKNLVLLVSILISINVGSQDAFSKKDYFDYLKNNTGLRYEDASNSYPLGNQYYMFENNKSLENKYSYLDSLILKYKLTADELSLIEKNGFVVTERLQYGSFFTALDDIYNKDMPVFVTTDAILFALHASYDNILEETEMRVLHPNLLAALNLMYTKFPKLVEKYQKNDSLTQCLKDVDLYVTVALSLAKGETKTALLANQKDVTDILSNIENQKPASVFLFSNVSRDIDFSQFTPRGHYLNRIELKKYFKTMMWMGRIDMWLTSLDERYKLTDLRRTNLDAFLLNELLDLSDTRTIIDDNNSIISFLVGECDNLTPTQLKNLQIAMSIRDVADLMNDTILNRWVNTLDTTPKIQQQIMSDIMVSNPFDPKPKKLPVSFRLMGQRFVIDSYIFANLSFDRIINNGKKEMRLMPSPLDIMFAMGNNSALPLLQDDIKTYNYSLQLTALRKLIEGYDTAYWKQTLYNTWLNSLRELNEPLDSLIVPEFMTTAAWQHEKLNTQLASWAHLRHDNLLYVKQSYSGVPVCSFPYSYIEPYPELYSQIKTFSDKAQVFFKKYESAIYFDTYFTRLSRVMNQLYMLSKKELGNIPFTDEEVKYLKSMLHSGRSCDNSIIYTGWYSEIYYNYVSQGDAVIADVHTQPADSAGNMIGKVLHVGTGNVNMGIFTCRAPMPDGRLMAFAGPLMSYYETITTNFKRLTDQEWRNMIYDKKLPVRPDWVNIYLANNNGNTMSKGRELKYSYKNVRETDISSLKTSKDFVLYPNPVDNELKLVFNSTEACNTNIKISDQTGRLILTTQKSIKPGRNSISIYTSNLKSGFYILNLTNGDKELKAIFIKQ
jgi:hypothetical protein